mgnify:CR=1 FL=1
MLSQDCPGVTPQGHSVDASFKLQDVRSGCDALRQDASVYQLVDCTYNCVSQWALRKLLSVLFCVLVQVCSHACLRRQVPLAIQLLGHPSWLCVPGWQDGRHHRAGQLCHTATSKIVRRAGQLGTVTLMHGVSAVVGGDPVAWRVLLPAQPG